MSAGTIPKEIKVWVEERVADFNKKTFKDASVGYGARFRGRFLYLDRDEFGKTGPICRLTYTGKSNDWDFAIFRWSDKRYDPDEWFFPGAEDVDGTVEGVLQVGLKAYPV